jgi:hypothetical protein
MRTTRAALILVACTAWLVGLMPPAGAVGTPHLVADINPGVNPSTNPLSLTSVNGTAFFVGTSSSQG